MKASRQFLTEATKKFQNLPFSLRSFENENAAKMGSLECANHGLITPYTVSYFTTSYNQLTIYLFRFSSTKILRLLRILRPLPSSSLTVSWKLPDFLWRKICTRPICASKTSNWLLCSKKHWSQRRRRVPRRKVELRSPKSQRSPKRRRPQLPPTRNLPSRRKSLKILKRIATKLLLF